MSPNNACLPPEIVASLSCYKRRLQQRFGERLHLCALFGSWARGDQRENSDVDVLVLLDGASRTERNEGIEMIADVDLETGIWLSPKVYSTEDFERLKQTESPFARAISEDSRPV